jgi:Fe-S-cluster containining protein
MTTCGQCGKCCECIILPHNSDYLRAGAKNDPDSEYGFVHRNFTQISKERALKINPYLSNWDTNNHWRFYYICRHFCTITKKCIVHEIRPGVCSEFPWYGRVPKEQPLYSKDCSFHKDLKKIKKVKNKNGTGKSN